MNFVLESVSIILDGLINCFYKLMEQIVNKKFCRTYRIRELFCTAAVHGDTSIFNLRYYYQVQLFIKPKKSIYVEVFT